MPTVPDVTRGLPLRLHDRARQLRAQWQQQHGVRPGQGRICWRRLVGRRCVISRAHVYLEHCAGPGADHPELFVRAGRPWALVHHPYPIRWADFAAEAAAWADACGLVLTVDEAPSWYYPGWTHLVVYRARQS